MAQLFEGLVAFVRFEKADLFNWTDPSTGQVKPLRSLKVLWSHGDGTVTRESITVPQDMEMPRLNPGEVYGFRVTSNVNKRRQIVSWTLVSDRALPALELG